MREGCVAIVKKKKKTWKPLFITQHTTLSKIKINAFWKIRSLK